VWTVKEIETKTIITMKRLIETIKNRLRRKPLLATPGVSTSICFCGKEGYECDVFNANHAFPTSEKITLCKEHIKEKCEQGFFVAL
jgi:hypothetical protein